MRWTKSPICRLAPFAAALLVAAGCTTTQSRQETSATDFASGNTPPGQTVNPDEILGTDPTAIRLQDIAGDFLLYMRIYKQMPPTLEDLRTIDNQMPAAALVSPGSGQLYVYVPAGLWLTGHSEHIVVYDPALTKQSKRWCLFLGPPHPNGSFSVDVVALPESIFQQYKPPAPH
jgi:hypothetical protein